MAGQAWQGTARQEWQGAAWPGEARRGEAGMAWHGKAWPGTARQARRGLARQGMARRGKAGMARDLLFKIKKRLRKMKHGHIKSRLDEYKKPKFDLIGILQSLSAYSAYCMLSMHLRMVITQPTNSESQKKKKQKAIKNILKDMQKIPEKISRKNIKKFLNKK